MHAHDKTEALEELAARARLHAVQVQLLIPRQRPPVPARLHMQIMTLSPHRHV